MGVEGWFLQMSIGKFNAKRRSDFAQTYINEPT